MEKKSATIKVIARLLKISTSTVSRALGNHPRISEVTKQRVKEMAEKVGYEKNILAVSFKQNKTFVIGVVIPSISENFFSEAISCIESLALQKNYTILFGQSYDNPDQEKIIAEIMRKRHVDGLIVSLSKKTYNYEYLKRLDQEGFPVVFFDRVPHDSDVHKVNCNLFNGTVEMINWLFGKGYRKVALLNGPANLPASKERLRGYIEGISRKKIKVDMQLVLNTDFSAKETREAMKSILAMKRKPNAIISFNDYVHMDAVQYAAANGVKVNKDIAFVSYSNLPITAYTAYPPLVSIEQYPFHQGEKAMEIMAKILEQKSMNNEDRVYYHEELSSTLVVYTPAQF